MSYRSVEQQRAMPARRKLDEAFHARFKKHAALYHGSPNAALTRLRGAKVKEAQGLGNYIRQYRRILNTLVSGNALLHSSEKKGPQALEGILTEGRVNVSQRGAADALRETNAAHGPGTYWLRGAPDDSHMVRRVSEGVVTPTAAGVPLRDNRLALDAYGNALPAHHALSPNPYNLRGKDFAVVDSTSRLQRALAAVRGGAGAKAPEVVSWDSVRKSLRPKPNTEGFNPQSWEAARRDLHANNPELRRLKGSAVGPYRQFETRGDLDQAVDEFVASKIGDPPRGGIRSVTSRIFDLARQDLDKARAGLIDPKTAINPAIRGIYKEDANLRRQLRRATAPQTPVPATVPTPPITPTPPAPPAPPAAPAPAVPQVRRR